MRFALLLIALLLQGCFWVSSPPDLHKEDQVVKLTVIWDHQISPDTFRREAWSTTDRAILDAVVPLLDTREWMSMTVLPACHPTRYIFQMRSGKIWEMCQGFDHPERFRMFDRTDRGWTGQIPRPQAFLDALTKKIQAEQDFPVDLNAEYSMAVVEGKMHKITPKATWAVLNEYPGYPETVWNPKTKKFEYLDNE